MILLDIENMALWAALVGYALATMIAMYALVFRKAPERTLFALMLFAWLLHTAAIGVRWDRIGHLPFINIFEMLSANIWGLMAALVLGYWLLPRVRTIAALAASVYLTIALTQLRAG